LFRINNCAGSMVVRVKYNFDADKVGDYGYICDLLYLDVHTEACLTYRLFRCRNSRMQPILSIPPNASDKFIYAGEMI
jgi:hypothetical protein